MFTPFQSFFGGTLIGLSAVILMLGMGRVMGATGILSGVLLPASSRDFSWRMALLLGMFSAPAVLLIGFNHTIAIQTVTSTPGLIIGGLLVGLGVSFGGGCTSGHGVCGNARLSARSIVATMTFMIATALTVFVIRHVLGA